MRSYSPSLDLIWRRGGPGRGATLPETRQDRLLRLLRELRNSEPELVQARGAGGGAAGDPYGLLAEGRLLTIGAPRPPLWPERMEEDKEVFRS